MSLTTSATKTANSAYTYSQVFFDKPLSQWVSEASAYNNQKQGWGNQKLQPGSFGYDNIAISLATLFEDESLSYIVQENSVEEGAGLIHYGWAINYCFWRDQKPWLKNKAYSKPSSPLGDERRNQCALLVYDDLSEEEKDKDRIFAEFVIANLQSHFPSQTEQSVEEDKQDTDEQCDEVEMQESVEESIEEDKTVSTSTTSTIPPNIEEQMYDYDEQSESVHQQPQVSNHVDQKPVFTKDQLQYVNMLIYEINAQKFIPKTTLYQVAQEHFGKECNERIGYPSANDVKRKVSPAKKNAMDVLMESSASTTLSSGCQHKFRMNSKVKPGQLCMDPVSPGTLFCKKHTKKTTTTTTLDAETDE